MSLFDLHRRKASSRKLNFDRAYRSWYALLSNKALNLFSWEGLPADLPQREIEFRLQFSDLAVTAITKSRRYKTLIAADASGYGVTQYRDVWTNIVWTCPGDSGIAPLTGKDQAAVLIRNNSSLLPTSILIERYANLLAHAELSLQAILINSRTTGILAARDDKQRQAIMEFYAALEDGRTLAIVDDMGLDSLVGSEGLRQIATTYPSSTSILDFWQARQNLYKEFLAEIGISKSTDKRERLITDEVAQDQPLYEYSLDDMLNMRQEGAKAMNDLFGLSVTVNVNPAIKVNAEEVSGNATEGTDQRSQSGTDSSDDNAK